MKLSISTLGCPGWGFEKIVNEFSALGVSGIEVRGIGGIMDFSKISELSEENIKGTLDKLSRKGLEFVCFGSSASFHDREKHLTTVADAKNTVDAAKRARVPYVRVFGNNVLPDSPDESMKNIIDGLVGVCEYAQGSGVTVCLEIHGDVNTAERLAAVTSALGKYDSFGIIWDVCHTFTSCGNDIDLVYNVIKPYVRHVHLKDAVKIDGKSVLRTLGEGDINIERIVKRLLDDGYDGYFSFEHEKVWHKELPEPEVEFPKFVEYMKRFEK